MHRLLMVLVMLAGSLWWLAAPLRGAPPSTPQTVPAAGIATPEFIENVDRSGGKATAIFPRIGHTAIARPDVTEIYDTSVLTAPVQIGKIINFSAAGSHNDFLYGAVTDGTIAPADGEWAMWDISAPAAPVEVGRFQPEGTLLASGNGLLVFRDERLFYPNGIVLYTIASDGMPQRAGTWNNFSVSWVEIVGSRLLLGTTELFCDHGYCEDQPRNLTILDVSDPAAPTVVGYGSAAMSERERAYRAMGDGILYQSHHQSGGRIYINQIVDDPAGVTLLHTLELNGFYAYDITVQGNALYVANEQQGTKIFDVSNPAAPVEVGIIGDVMGGVTESTILYGLATPYVTLFDVSAPLTPTLLTTIFHAQGQWLLRHENLLYLIDGNYTSRYPFYLHTLDISSPAAPRLLRTDVLDNNADGGDYGYTPFEFNLVQGSHLYAARRQQFGQDAGVDVFRLPTSATTPLTLQRILGGLDVYETHAVGNLFLLHTAVDAPDVLIYNTTNPQNPIYSAVYYPPYQGYFGMQSEGDRLYVHDETAPDAHRFWILDASGSSPVTLGMIEENVVIPDHEAWTVSNGILYFRHDDGLGVADARDPEVPVVTVIPMPGMSQSHHLWRGDGERLYSTMSSCLLDVRVYTLANPLYPTLTDGTTEQRNCDNPRRDLLPNGDYFYVASDVHGLDTFGFKEGVAHFLPLMHNGR